MNKVYIENREGSYTYDYLTFSEPLPDEAPNRYYWLMKQELAGKVKIDGEPVVASVDKYAGSDREAADIAAQVETTERNWRDAELSNADVEIYKLEDSAGDTAAWRVYRQALRDYPQQPDFPNGYRPTLD
jgi:hypothetical protein